LPSTDARQLEDLSFKRQLIFGAPGRVEYNAMARLNVLDHGKKDGIQLGSDWIDSSNVTNYEPAFRKLRGRFDRGGFVDLQRGWTFQATWAYFCNRQLEQAFGRVAS
jgi:hypothetical protein